MPRIIALARMDGGVGIKLDMPPDTEEGSVTILTEEEYSRLKDTIARQQQEIKRLTKLVDMYKEYGA